MRCFLILLLIPLFCFGDQTVKDRLLKSQPGDFVVTEQGPHYSLLLVRTVDPQKAILEEVTVEKGKIDLKKISWKNWIENKAPGAESWTGFYLNLSKNTLERSFSYLDNQWLYIEKSDYLVKNLLTIPFRPTRDTERKKIGPSPMPGEIDRRKFWKPQLMREGKQKKQCEYQVCRSKWPADKTPIAGCIIEMYLDAHEPAFPFPYWMEVQHPHFTFKVRTIDSGCGIQSPARLLQ